MDQLVQMMRQRSSDILILQKSPFHNFPELLIKEKDRSQKQNWVLKILKSIKVLTPQLKSDIFYKSQEMMTIYEKVSLERKENLDEHFTEKVINLYIDFFNLISEKIPQNNSIKSIVRPNNNQAYIITDLIKCIIDLQRKKFRDLYIVASTLDGEIRPKGKRIINQILTDPDLTFAQIKEIQFTEKNLILKPKKPNNPQQLLKKALKQKFSNFIKMIDIKELENRINLNFLQLKEKNQKNGYFMEKFRQKCLGKKTAKNTNYDLAGLYTKEELKKIQQKLNAKTQTDKPLQDLDPMQQMQCITENESRPTQASCSLRQAALNQLEKLQNLNIYQKSTSKKSSAIQNWLRLSIMKRLSKQNPWQIYIINNKRKIKSSEIIEDPQISSVGVKQFLLMKMNQIFTVDLVKVDDEEAENRIFDKRVFLDFGRKKEFQLVEGDKIVLRRELFFPVLKENEEKEQFSERNQYKQPQQILRRKSKSESKFLPRFTKLHTSEKTAIEQQINASLIQKHPLPPQVNHQTIVKSQDLKPLKLKNSPLSLKIRKNSMEDILSERILQRKLQIEEENMRYQNRMKLLFGTETQRNLIRAKNKKHKTSLMGISVPFGNQHFLQ